VISFHRYFVPTAPKLFTGFQIVAMKYIGTIGFIVIEKVDFAFKDGCPGMAFTQLFRPKNITGTRFKIGCQLAVDLVNIVGIDASETRPGLFEVALFLGETFVKFANLNDH
jgi:hypothetical protein